MEVSGHIYHRCNDIDCYLCSHELDQCEKCRCAEGELTSDCPGVPVAEILREKIMKNKLNFVNGQWEELDG